MVFPSFSLDKPKQEGSSSFHSGSLHKSCSRGYPAMKYGAPTIRPAANLPIAVVRKRKQPPSGWRKPMKKPLPRFLVVVLVAACWFHTEANAQGCHQVVLDLPDILCCGTYYQANSTCQNYVVPGDYSLFCTLGSGDCCGQGYHEANTVYDEKDCGQCVVCPRTGHVQCGNPPPPATDLRS